MPSYIVLISIFQSKRADIVVSFLIFFLFGGEGGGGGGGRGYCIIYAYNQIEHRDYSYVYVCA